MKPLPTIKTGEKYGRWTALEDGQRARRSKVLCRCECGTEKRIRATSLRHGRSTSCGCLARELLLARNTTHGLKQHPLYSAWRGMIQRCTNPDWVGYEDYGGRGITVCERWQGLPDGLLNFAADMGPRPGPGYTNERRDNDGNYEPENCVWVTAKEQSANMRPRARQAELRALRAENERLRRRVAELEALLAERESDA